MVSRLRQGCKHKKDSGQGLIEFALTIPILLILLLGIIAMGHLMLSFVLNISAAREGARYGVTTGISPNGIPRYQDCAEIRQLATRVGGMIGVGDTDVDIHYDTGPGSPTYANCPIGGQGPDADTGDRIVVTVDSLYTPILPFINLPTIPISTTVRRTIITGISIEVP